MDNLPKVVSSEEWLVERKKLLAKEKDLMKAQDQLKSERRLLPMVRIEKNYAFEGPKGPLGLLDMFDGRDQLVIHHLMFHPGDGNPCRNCCSLGDMIDGQLRQVHARNTTVVGVSRAPFNKLEHYQKRMGWSFPWYSSYGSDFNYDFHTTLDNRVTPVLVQMRNETELAEKGIPWREVDNDSETSGMSCFLCVDGEVYHTYSTFGRGIEPFMSGYNYLDITALGCQEEWE